mgnify:FL=1|jgi:glycosyltransferase involved in cell wall biosynthesis
MAKKIKIGFLDIAKKESGGIYQYSQSILDSLNNRSEYEVIVYSNKRIPIDDNFKYRNLSYKKGLLKYINLIGIYIKYFFKIKPKIYKDIDIFISPFPALAPHFFLKSKFIFTLHDLQEEYYPKNFTKKEILIRRLRNYLLLKKCLFVICESSSVKHDIIKFYKVDSKKIAVIPSPPPKSIFTDQKDGQKASVIAKYSLNKEYIFYPAQFWPHKNHLNMMKAIKILKMRHPNILLVLTGSERFLYQEIFNKIEELGINNNILHIGNVPYEDLISIFKNAKMLVMPTMFESISIPIYEAFCFNVPVVCSNVCGLPEQCGEAAIFFNPQDPKDIAEKVQSVIDDHFLIKKLINNGTKIINERTHDAFFAQLQIEINLRI